MKLEMLTDIIICIACMISTIYGFVSILITKKGLYIKMVVLAIACMMISRINIVIQYLTNGTELQGYHVGLLGVIGCFLFLLSSNYGEMDRLVDDGSSEYTKYRLLSWIAPIVLLTIYSQVFLSNGSHSRTAICTVAMLFLAIAARFHFKHLIFPDVDYGIIRCIRGYNVVALVLCLATTLMMMADVLENSVIFFVAGIVMALCCLIMLPLLQKEVAKWTTI